jgi:hypothetical protein
VELQAAVRAGEAVAAKQLVFRERRRHVEQVDARRASQGADRVDFDARLAARDRVDAAAQRR